MDPSWSNGVYAGDVPTDFDEVRKREDRRERISQYWDLLVVDQEPRVTKGTLLHLMQDLKDEGNILFKELHYDIAWMHYRNALFIARILSTRFYHEVDKEFLSTLFSNRAFCCLKKDMYQEAIQDCESAIRINENNIKAYYRQVLGLKAQKKHAEALKVAEMGYLKQPSIFKETVEELRDIVTQQTKTLQTQVSVKDSVKITEKSVPDPDWLKGTNVKVTQMNESAKTKTNNKQEKVKSNNVNSKNNGKSVTTPVSLNGGTSSESDSEHSDDRLSEDETFASTFLNFKNPKKPLGGKNTPNIKVEVQKPKKTSVSDLDSFSPPAKSSKAAPAPTSQKSTPQSSTKEKPAALKLAAEKKSTTVTLTLDDIKNVKFPLSSYDFKLACQTCFKKIGDGMSGYQYTDSQHVCTRDIFIVKLRQKNAINWLKIRPRIEPKFQQYGGYKLCTHFQANRPCKVKEELCTFAHNKAEVELWTMDKEGAFNINGYMKKLKSIGIMSSDQLNSLEDKLKQLQKQEIPGMSYKNRKPVEIKQTVPEVVTPEPVEKEPVKEAPKGKSAPPPEPVKAPRFEQQAKEVAAKLKSVEEVPQPSPPPRRPPLLQNPPRPQMPSNHQQTAMYTGQPLLSGPVINAPNPPVSVYHPPMPNLSQPPPPLMQPPMMQPQYLSRYSFPPPPLHRPPPVFPGLPRQSHPPPVRMPGPNIVPEAPKLEHNHVIIKQAEDTKPSKIIFPYKDTHDFKLLCKNCCSLGDFGQLYIHDVTHKCEEDIFAVKPKHSLVFIHVRERKNHRDFLGRYKLCNSYVYRNPLNCIYGPEGCSFAHSEVEQSLWTLEKDDVFSITEFILQNRSQRYTMMDILRKHDGNFSFICRACFNHIPMWISFMSEENKLVCSGDLRHPWIQSKILAHFGVDGTITVINSRGFLHKTAFFKLCKWLKFCRNSRTGECRFAHSFVERDIWMLERDSGLSQEEIVNEVNKILSGNDREQRREPAPPPAPSTPTLASTIKSTASQPIQMKEQKKTEVEFDEDACPWVILQICTTCWKNGMKSIRDGEKDRCAKRHSNWSTNKMLLLASNNKEIRPLPKKIPQGFRFLMCKGIKERNKCAYNGPGNCSFAHGEDELKIWQWMCAHDVKTPDELHERSKEALESRASAEKSRIASGESVVTVSHSKVAMPIHIKSSTHYCPYCGVQCNSQKQWDEHCASEKHNFNVNSDKEHQWNYRQPPWGLASVNYTLCSQHTNGNKCQYSNAPDMYNLCQSAHSQEELDEWRERYEWRQMKRDMARQEQVFSFMDQLVEQYENEDCSVKVISESLPGVMVTCVESLNIYEEEKNANFTWMFTVKARMPLDRVALLHNRDRLHFTIQGGNFEKGCQIAPGTMFEDVDNSGSPCYIVRINFNGTMFGSFGQWVVFDFGSQPVLVRKLSVEVGTKSTHDKVKSLRQKLQFDRWTSENREIVRFETKFIDELGEKLKRQYKAPSSSESVITQHTVATELNRNNYHHMMHKFLDLEEMSRHQIISSYNLCTTIELQNAIQGTTYLYAQSGELFAKVLLIDYLTEDTDAGKLILTSVRTVLIAPQDQHDNIVYEALVVGKENYDFDGRGKEYIYISLPPQCVKNLNALGYKNGSNVEVEIQFQMDRGLFCMMHHAVDCLQSSDIVFPDISKINPQWNEKHVIKVSSNILNGDQVQAVQHIVAERLGYTPPFVIYGAFGTGKTETIGQASMVLLKEMPSSKILICAQSNSAADLYITKHLDPYLKKTNQTHLLRRVYFTERRVNTVAPSVQKYCLLSQDKSMFVIPTKEDIHKHRIVIVTLSTSLALTNLGIQGYFTHIFVDEAAQALEAETVMPLTLATDKTCIVLAGDHQQISPKIYSHEATKQKFNMSLLERLHLYYDSYSNRMDKSSPLNLLLSINYRTKMEILRFISSVFYGGPDRLISHANLPSVLEITPLMFYGVQGVEIQDKDSVSFYNTSEVQEVVERVKELYDGWPPQWGPRQAKDIGVVTPYYDQVQLIRKSLRKRHPDLRTVTVERVNNVQGKEFRALFISTVRTRSLIDSVQSNTSEEDMGDFGFLSDSKLLNTALTRAQSFVAVVGDPVALCAIGECINVWRTYLQHCRNMKSIRPSSMTLEAIKQQVTNMMNSNTAKEKMVKIAEKRKPVSQPPPLSQPQKLPPWKMAAGAAPTLMNGDINHALHDGDGTVYNYNISPEGAIRQLAAMDSSLNGSGQINVQLIDNLAVICDGRKQATTNTPSAERLNSLVASNPFKYRHCILKYNDGHLCGNVMDSKLPDVMLNTQKDCRGAFPGDQVVIEMADDGESGFVIGVLKDGIDLSERAFACRIDPENTGLLIPVDVGISKMYNVITAAHVNRVNKGYVCVYTLNKNGKISFSNYEKINILDPSEKIFIVKFLQWDQDLEIPLCIVVGVCPVNSSVESVIDVLNIDYNIPSSINSADLDHLYPDNYELPSDVYASHSDLRDKWTFTISTEEEAVNAFNIEETGDGHYVIGIHTSDVSYFVTKDSPIDIVAKQHKVSHSSPGKLAVPVIPSKLLHNVCSFRTGVDCVSLSVFLTVKKTGDIIAVDTKTTVINSKQNFSYREVEEILNEPAASNDYLKSCILVLVYVCGMCRQKRLGNAGLYFDLDIQDKTTPEAHILVQELMITTNYHIAQYLLTKVPDLTPLLCQLPPRESLLQLWKKQYAADALNSIALTQPFLEIGNVCKCKVACTCIVSYLRQNNIRINDTFSMYTVLFEAICQAAEVNDIQTIQKIVVSAESHPQIASALQKLKHLLDQANYQCSGVLNLSDRCMFSLNLANFVHMMSPAHSYMDIVVHRLIKSTVEQQSAPYKAEEVSYLCDIINGSIQNKKLYEESVDMINLCSALESRPLTLYPIIESVNETEIKLCFPSLESFPEHQRHVSLDLLKPDKLTLEKQDVINVSMESSIYDVTGKIAAVEGNSSLIINPDQFVSKIPSFQWQKLIIAVREENVEKLQTVASSLKTSTINMGKGLFSTEISSEHLVADNKARQIVMFERKFSVGNVIQVQIMNSKLFGIPTPSVQLINFTPQLDVCIEHRTNPVSCFTISKDVEPISSYSDEESYKKAWLSVLNLEASEQAVSTGDSVIIHNVVMDWQEVSNSYTASFSLRLDFCKQRQLNFGCHGYFCIRYKGLDIPHNPILNERTLLVVNNGVPVTWVGHGILLRQMQQTDSIMVQLQLTGSSVKFPIQLLTQAAKSLPCTIEWIPKCSADMFIEEALLLLPESSQLARDIAKHRNPVPLENNPYEPPKLGLKKNNSLTELIDKWLEDMESDGSKTPLINVSMKQLPKPDPSQEEALNMGITKPFSVIRGGAGTGKSMLAARLILTFTEKNRRTPRTDMKPQVMVCGPTEQTLDSVASYLMLCETCPKIVRVYSEETEQKDFPSYTCRRTLGGRNIPVTSMVDIALHHRIRGASSQFGDSIQEHDMLLQLYPDDIGREQIEEYMATVMKAEVAELREADIIMCTCVTSARAKLRHHTNICQVVIDDCGMCSEPESMTPIILNRNIQQVTLFGDSQGLKPNVHSKTARLLGLQRSLMEAYVDKTIDLKTQYRMHDGIAELPSELFYNKLLVTSGKMNSASSFLPNKPVIFCKVIGQEELIKDSDSEDKSLCNRTDANTTISAISNLVRHRRVEESNIVVLSPYQAQVDLVTKGLLQQGLSKVEVTTVLQGQGRQWDYVVVSLVRSLPTNKIEKNPDHDWIRKYVSEVSDTNQINLMLTRSRCGLILIGNEELLQVCPLWKTIVYKLQNWGQVMACTDFLRMI